MLIETNSKDAAKFFISLSNETGNLLSNLKLQKLLYYLQAWHLAKFEKELFKGDFQAWVHGPVLPSIYREYKHFKWHPIDENVGDGFFEQFLNELSPEQQDLLKDVVNEYFGDTAYELELMTHRESPWLIARGGIPMDEPSESVISNESMIDYYKKFLVNG